MDDKTFPKRSLQYNLNESWNRSWKMNPCLYEEKNEYLLFIYFDVVLLK